MDTSSSMSHGSSVPQPAAKVTADRKDPSWWRLGAVPFIVLVMVSLAADLAWPRTVGVGLGAGIGCFLAINALLLLRRDISRGEYCFLQGLACLNMLALFCSGNYLNWFTSLILPFVVVMLPSQKSYAEPGVHYRNWWSYWMARRSSVELKGRFAAIRSLLPTLICILIGIICFVAFLCIFASGNPVVMLVFETITAWWNNLLEFLHISWDFWLHALYWLVGFFWFGLYCFVRPAVGGKNLPPVPPAEIKKGSPALPYLPLCVLIGVNAAFAVATSTDIAYLWFGKVPEGVSQTVYLHEGACSISWASGLASLLLVLLFRRNGVARESVFGRILGYLLVVQTTLLAVSVYMRLYYQIGDFGFTVRRIQAAEAILLGVAGLVVLVLYMATNGTFWKHARICLGTMLLMLIAFFSYSPARLAGNLNLIYVNSHPHWNFALNDFKIGRFDENENLSFAEYAYNKAVADGRVLSDNTYGLMESDLKAAAHKVERAVRDGSWVTFNLCLKEDIPAAERILGRPIVPKSVEQAY